MDLPQQGYRATKPRARAPPPHSRLCAV
ncbi:hypothetical protein CesoFtcFv8_010025 [Champsocephalus esox]|uniref:Uncharacterized protein n=1 Tax=Champsocephalus esox TaxID=159716 RepID=A0AAN8C4D3_9TELE|nr:hypothetical protein CesoFtcFv8_010025 [Champsocephalus esox]